MAILRWVVFLLLLLAATADTETEGEGPYCIKVPEEVCTTEGEEICEDIVRKQCDAQDQETCIYGNKQTCTYVQKAPTCATSSREVCQDAEKQYCTKKEATVCEDVKKWICPAEDGGEGYLCTCSVRHGRRLRLCESDCKRYWNEAHCWTELGKVCRTVTQPVCTKHVEKICKKIPEEKCTPQKEKVCNDLPTQKCTTKPVVRCKEIPETLCRTENSTTCETVLVDRFCGSDDAARLRAAVFNEDLEDASTVLSGSQNLFSLGEGLTFFPEQEFLVVQSENRTQDPDISAIQALAQAALNGTNVYKLVNAVLLSFIPDCRCREFTTEEYNSISRTLAERLSDKAYLTALLDDDPSEFEEARRRRRLQIVNGAPAGSLVCSFCSPADFCGSFAWCS